jgi:hypothetical protein
MGFTALINLPQKSFIFSKNKVVFSVIFAPFTRDKNQEAGVKTFLVS